MRYADWIRKAVPDSRRVDPRRTTKTIADSFKEDVRNGLVHHARLNRGAEFSLDLEQSMDVVDSVLVVNPLLLLDEVVVAWEATIARVRSEPDFHYCIGERVQRVFRVEFEADQAWAQSGNSG